MPEPLSPDAGARRRSGADGATLPGGFRLPVESPWVRSFRGAYERGGMATIVSVVTIVSTIVSMVVTAAMQTALGLEGDHFRMGMLVASLVPLAVAPPVTFLFGRMTDHLLALEVCLSEIATRDALTGARNRRWIMDRCLERAAAAPAGSGAAAPAPSGILMIDVDHFKSINDRHGHPVGDRVLKAVADALAATMRPTDCFGRYGGEEFLVLTGDAEGRTLARCAEALRQAVERMPHDPDRPGLSVTVSIGAALLRPDGTEATLAEALRAADAALYRAKAGGRNRVVTDRPSADAVEPAAPSPDPGAPRSPGLAPWCAAPGRG